MTTVSNSIVISNSSALYLSSESLKSVNHYATILGPNNSSFSLKGARKSSAPKRKLTLQASYNDRPSSGSIFVGGFVLGGLIIGTLGCVYAPQISKALAGASSVDKKDLMRKLPKFIYDEEKASERKRKEIAEEIKQLNLALDNISKQWQFDEPPNGAAVNSDDKEALI